MLVTHVLGSSSRCVLNGGCCAYSLYLPGNAAKCGERRGVGRRAKTVMYIGVVKRMGRLLGNIYLRVGFPRRPPLISFSEMVDF